ncbi:MAG: hypothetical protein IPK26_02300 [Planctomycetes bacterium]|nr:hypothetical protein [Planctomycetota bacterium]
MSRRGPFLLLALLPGCSGCGAPSTLASGRIALAPELREVSAIVAIDAAQAVCVQDEVGVLFTVDITDGRLRRQQPFGRAGDYEGLCRVGEQWFVLRSDGVLSCLQPDADRLQVAGSWQLPWPHDEWEGLCHDPASRRLLLAPKSVDGKGKNGRDRRPLYAFDLVERRPEPAAFLELSVQDLAEQATALGIAVPTKTTERGKERLDLQLLWSEIAIAPTGDLVLLSAAGHALVTVDRTGRLRDLQFLDASVLPQPEGMTFLTDGRLLIASEAGGGGAAIAAIVPWSPRR